MAPLKPYLTENTRKTDSLPEEGQDNGQVCKGQQLGFVAFVGYKALSVPEKVEKEIWSVDTQLVQELGNMDGLFAYICGERVKGGDYSNLVLFQNRESLQDLFQSPNHEQAKSSLSPRFYTHVRIHSGSLQDGLTSPYFTLEKTIFLFFTLPADDPGRRRVQLWRARRDEFDDVKVLRH